MHVHVLLYDFGSENEGIHSLEISGSTVVLMFENQDDAERYSGLLEAQDFPQPTVEVLDSDEKTAGGIIIPDTAKEKPQEGEVVAVGPGGKNEDGKLTPMDVKVGDIVLFGKWSGTEVKIDGKEYSIMKESDIMGISKGKK